MDALSDRFGRFSYYYYQSYKVYHQYITLLLITEQGYEHNSLIVLHTI